MESKEISILMSTDLIKKMANSCKDNNLLHFYIRRTTKGNYEYVGYKEMDKEAV